MLEHSITTEISLTNEQAKDNKFERHFSCFKAPIKNTLPFGDITLSHAYEWIKYYYTKETEQVRNGIVSKVEILPYITPSGTFSSRKDSDLLIYSGIICIDLDNCNIEIKDTLAGDTFLNPTMIFISPSGNGLKVFISIENAFVENHLKYFSAISQYLLNTYRLEADKACKDISRACFLCNDPAVYYSEGTVESETLLSILQTNQILHQPEANIQSPPILAKIPDIHQRPSEELNRLPMIHAKAVSSLLKHGWQQFGDDWVRPGKDPRKGISAKFNQDPKDGLYKFTNFSAKGQPFEVKVYTDVQVICELEYTGDFNACIRELAKEYLSQVTASKKQKKVAKIELLPIEGMPRFIRDYITTCSETFNTPRDFWAGAAIMATALAIGDKFQLVGQYDNVPIIWMNIIGDVSSGKTEAMNFSLKPFEEMDSKAAEQFKRDYQEYESIESMSAKDRRDAGIDRKTKPACFQYIVKDSTPEALNQVHSINHRGLMIARDELKGWLDDFGRYSKSGEQSNMLSSFNQVRWVTNRKSGGIDSVLEISKPCILVFGGMQPDLIPTLAADNRAENGFLARFCSVWPDHTSKPKYNKKVVPDALKKQWKEYLINLTKIPTTENITLSDQAENLYQDWYNRNADISDNGDSGYLKGVYGKLDIIALRMAIVIYGMNQHNEREYSNQIIADEMVSALNITEYFRSTALKVYQKIFDNRTGLDKKELIKYLSGLGHSQTKIAEIIKVSQPYVNKILK